MTFLRLIGRGLVFHRRMHAAVAAGVAVAVAAVVGALVVGDSVRGTLRESLVGRLGGVSLAMETPGRFFRAEWAEEVGKELGAPAAAGVELTAAAAAGEVRANGVTVYAVDERFWALAGYEGAGPAGEGVIINKALARKLGVSAGGEIRLVLPPAGTIGGETPLPGAAPATVRPAVTVAAVLDTGDFGLRAQQREPLNVFVSPAWLAGQTGWREQAGEANLLVTGAGDAKAAVAALRRRMQLADVGLSVRPVAGTEMAEVRSGAVFIPEPLEQALRAGTPEGKGVLAYFTNRVAAGGRSSPYAVVAGLEPGQGPVPADLKEDELVATTWLAEDLGLKAGDEATLEYFVPGSAGGLETKSRRFRVRGVAAPVEAPGADRGLMPEYPGLKDIQDCRNWKPGVTLSEPIRPKDDAYWKEHRGAPKAYVTLAAARGMWANRFGALTAWRVPAAQAGPRVTQALREHLPADALGLAFRPVRQEAQRAAREGTDFSGLFLALSFFLIAAALLLLGLLFSLGVSQRAAEGGALLAIGFTPRQVRRVFFGEAAAAAIAGAAAGVGLGLAYTKGLLWGLAALWGGATGGARIEFHAEPRSVCYGVVGALAVALAAMRAAMHWRLRLPVRQLLAGADTTEAGRPGGGLGRKVALRAAVVAAAGWAAYAVLYGRAIGAETSFFISGAMLLVLGVLGAGAVIEGRARKGAGTLAGLAARNAARRMRRSLTVVGALACGCFVVVAVGASRMGPPEDPPKRAGGQGGFSLYAETAAPVVKPPLPPRGLDVTLVKMRLRAGDAADCFNLARAQRPRILGVDPKAMQGRFTFTRAAGRPAWDLLEKDDGPDVIPAIGDEPTVRWALGLTGDAALSVTDEAGRSRRVVIVGVLSGSVLQGNLIVSEKQFTRAWPSVAGYSVFLAETARPAEAARWLRGLSRQAGAAGLEDYGVDVERTADRMAAFASVENTYLSIFGVLGALGLLLGSAALAVLVAGNVQARRGELAILRAVGFDRPAVKRLVVREHLLLVGLGLAVGVAAGALAVAPAGRAMDRPVALLPLAVLLSAVAAAAIAWVYAATGWATRGEPLAALRNE